MKTVEKVNELIKASLEELLKVGNEGDTPVKTDSKLIFPQKRDKSKRNSEQEARFLFVREVEKQNEYYYSVETPTKEKYSGFKAKNPKLSTDGGRSASIDVCLYKINDNHYERKHLIEFKAHTKGESDILKDFLKLLCDGKGLTNYFVHIITNSNVDTLPTIKDRYEQALKNALKQKSKDLSNLYIFLCDMGKKTITQYKVIDNKIEKLK
jgi:hypothetical protein